MVTTIRLVNKSFTSHVYFCMCVVRTFKMYTFSNLHMYNTVLLTVFTMLYIKSPELIDLITGSLYSFSNISPFPPPLTPSNHQSALYF